MNIPFKKTYYNDREADTVRNALLSGTDYAAKAKEALSAHFGHNRLFLTSGASSAFDLLFTALDLRHGSEVILPSFTYPSAANTLMRCGLRPVFADIDERTLTLDLGDVKRKWTKQTRAVIPTHYGGVSADLDALSDICDDALLIEDAALSLGASYKGKPLGTVGDFGIVSFHHTKNVSAGQGGLLIVGDTHASDMERLHTVRNNGTDQAAFVRGQVDAYSWQRVGISAKMPNINAAVLCAQLDKADEIKRRQKAVWTYYHTRFSAWEDITLPHVPAYNDDNAHVFYLLFDNADTRECVRSSLADRGIGAYFHYFPLHASHMGSKLGYHPDDLPVTQRVSACMLRLPIYASLTEEACDTVVAAVLEAMHP